MAYKFQLGAFTASGSIKAESGFDANEQPLDNVSNLSNNGNDVEYNDSILMSGSTKIKLAHADASLGGDGNGSMQIEAPAGQSVAFVNGVDTPLSIGADLTVDAPLSSSTYISASNIVLQDASTLAGTALVNSGGQLAVSGLANAQVDAAAGIEFSKMETITAADIIVGNGSGVPTAVAMSGDVAIDNAGATTIQPNAVEGSMLNSNTAGDGLTYSSNALNVQVSGAMAIKSDKIALSSSIAGTGIGLAPGDLSSGIASSLELDILGLSALGSATVAQTDMLALHDDGAGVKSVTFSNLEDSIFDNVSGDATIAAGGALTLEAAQTNITSLLATDIKIGEDDQTKIDFETPDEIHFYAANAEQVYVADGVFGPETDSDVDLGTTGARWKDLYVDSITVTDDVTIAGNLTVTGTTVEIDAAFVVTSSIQFEGLTPDGNEISLTSADPTADRTITLPDLDGHIPLLAGAVSSADVTAAEFALLYGGSAIGTSIVSSGDGFLHNDGGTMKQTDVDSLASFIGNNLAVNIQNVAALGTLQVGVNYFSDMGSDGEDAVTLPASPSVGQSVKVKAPSDCSEARYITINRAGSQTIDGATSIRLESPFAAVELVYVASNLWRVF